MVLSVLRLIYRLKMYGSRTITTVKKKPTKGKKGAKMSAPMRDEPEGSFITILFDKSTCFIVSVVVFCITS